MCVKIAWYDARHHRGSHPQHTIPHTHRHCRNGWWQLRFASNRWTFFTALCVLCWNHALNSNKFHISYVCESNGSPWIRVVSFGFFVFFWPHHVSRIRNSDFFKVIRRLGLSLWNVSHIAGVSSVRIQWIVSIASPTYIYLTLFIFGQVEIESSPDNFNTSNNNK